jgi:hypothetical protein
VKTYYANHDGWVNGQRVTRGQAIPLSTAQAKYEDVRDTPPETEARAAKKVEVASK